MKFVSEYFRELVASVMFNSMSVKEINTKRAYQRLAEDVKLFNPLINSWLNWPDMSRARNRLNVNVTLIQINLHVVRTTQYEDVVVVLERQDHELQRLPAVFHLVRTQLVKC